MNLLNLFVWFLFFFSFLPDDGARVSQVEQRILDHVAFSPQPIQDLRDQLDRLKESMGELSV